MSRIFYRKRFSDYLGEQRAIDDIVQFYQPDGGITPTPTPVPVTPTPTPSITPTNTNTPTNTTTPTTTLTPTNTTTPSITPSVTSTLTPTPTNTGTPTPTPTRTPAPACDITYTELPSPTPSPTPTTTPTPTPTITPTKTPTPTPTPSVSPGPSFDTDAAAYLSAVISAGGSVTSPMSAATDTLYTSLKSNGLYTKMISFYPILGGVQNSHSINGNLNATYNISYNGAWTHSISGQTGPNGGYGLTNYIIPSGSTSGSTQNLSIGVYANTNTDTYSGFEMDMGVRNNAGGGNGNWRLIVGWGGTNESRVYMGSTTNEATISPRKGAGFYIGTRTINTAKLFYNGVLQVTSSPTIDETSQYAMSLGGEYNGTSNQFPSSKRQAFAFVSQYLTDGEVLTLSSIINTFQTSLGRNTY